MILHEIKHPNGYVRAIALRTRDLSIIARALPGKSVETIKDGDTIRLEARDGFSGMRGIDR